MTIKTTISSLARHAAALSLAGAACCATAGPVLMQTGFANAGDPTTLTIAGGPHSGTFYAGEFTGTVGGDSFLSYCVDLAQFFDFGIGYTDYTAAVGSTLFGAAKATQLGALLKAVGGFATASTPSRSAAVQAGLWEILYETGPTLSLAGGSFTAVGGTTAAADFGVVDGYLGHLNDYAATDFMVYASPTSQDFITAAVGGFNPTAVVVPGDPLALPEPSGAALAALALGGAALAGRRRRA